MVVVEVLVFAVGAVVVVAVLGSAVRTVVVPRGERDLEPAIVEALLGLGLIAPTHLRRQSMRLRRQTTKREGP